MEQASGGPASMVVRVADSSEVGTARRAAAGLAATAGLDETAGGALAIVVTEIATNLALHATEGSVVLRAIGAPGAGGVEVLALDKGPGIRDLTRAMSDGYSTAGTAGKGLGAIRRMAHEFDLTSSASAGTAIVARVWSGAGLASRAKQPRTDGVVCTPIAGEHVSGDGWLVLHEASRTLAVIVDGLGHGPEAARAADAAMRVIRARPDLPPAQHAQAVHGALRVTRGAAVAIAEIVPAEGQVRFAGIGNISAAIATDTGLKSMASMNGTAGHIVHRVQEFTYAWAADSCLIMHSDGLMTRWKLDGYPGLASRHPALVAGVLHRDFTRGRDDATVLAVRHRALQD